MPSSPYRVSIAHADRDADAERLRGALAAECEAMTANAAVIDFSPLPAAAGVDEPPAVLVVLGSDAAASDPGVMAQIDLAEQQLVPPLAVIRPSNRRSNDFESQVPQSLHRRLAYSWDPGGPVDGLVRHVFRLVGLCEADRRVFLSYRREDGSRLADGLREKLLSAGWDVFLDRFSIEVAEDFQRRLDLELADKAFVLLLETPDAKNSRWAEREITFALRHGLALMTLELPTLPPEDRFHLVPPDHRYSLRECDLMPGAAPSEQELTPEALERILHVMELRHGAALRRRRDIALRSAMHDMLDLGYRTTKLTPWMILGDKASDREVVLVTSRAPAPADLRKVDIARRSERVRGTRGWVVHPAEDVDEERVELLQWMVKRRSLDTAPAMLFKKRLASRLKK